MKTSLRLGSVSGIQISVHWTFLILIAWIVFNSLVRGLGMEEAIWSVVFVLTIFGCVTLHELGHALAAKRFKIKTRSITLLPIGGVAQMESLPEKPKEELIVALAGPAVNFLIVGVLFLVLRDSLDMETLTSLQTIGQSNFLYALMFVNFWLAIFNLIPAFPMDGGRVLRALLAFRMSRTRATQIAARLGQLLAIGFIFLGLYSNPFLVFIGLFVFLGAESEAGHVQAQSLLKGYKVSDALLKDTPVLGPHDTIRDAAGLLLRGQHKYFLVGSKGKPEGTIGRDDIIRGLEASGGEASVREAMQHKILYLTPDMPIESAWQQMREQGCEFALVSENDQYIGALDLDNIAEMVMIRSAEQAKKGGS